MLEALFQSSDNSSDRVAATNHFISKNIPGIIKTVSEGNAITA